MCFEKPRPAPVGGSWLCLLDVAGRPELLEFGSSRLYGVKLQTTPVGERITRQSYIMRVCAKYSASLIPHSYARGDAGTCARGTTAGPRPDRTAFRDGVSRVVLRHMA